MTWHWSDRLRSLGACGEAMAFCENQSSLEMAWSRCSRSDWMLWLIGACANWWTPARRTLVEVGLTIIEGHRDRVRGSYERGLFETGIQTLAEWIDEASQEYTDLRWLELELGQHTGGEYRSDLVVPGPFLGLYRLTQLTYCPGRRASGLSPFVSPGALRRLHPKPPELP